MKRYCPQCNEVYVPKVFAHMGHGEQLTASDEEADGPRMPKAQTEAQRTHIRIAVGALAGLYVYSTTRSPFSGAMAFVVGVAIGCTKLGSTIFTLAVIGGILLVVYALWG